MKKKVKIQLTIDEKSFQMYDEYLLKMQKMAEETKAIESNMRGFSNQIQNMMAAGGGAMSSS
jgi:hypothetical protein